MITTVSQYGRVVATPQRTEFSAVAGVTHKDLLLETPVALPILQVAIPLTQFFQFAPVLLVLFHLGLVSQLVLLARKTLEFDAAVRSLEYMRRYPRWPLSRIAAETGFTDHAHCTRVFRRVFGVTPSQVRLVAREIVAADARSIHLGRPPLAPANG